MTAVVLALGTVLLACGESKLDTSTLESQISKSLTERTGVRVTSVKCPDNVEAKEGDTFRCTATTVRHEQVTVNVTQDDSKGAVTWRIAGR